MNCLLPSNLLQNKWLRFCIFIQNQIDMIMLKNLISTTLLSALLSCTAASTPEKNEQNLQTEQKQAKVAAKDFSGTIVRDCTGSYVQMNGKDYLVCNFKKIENLKTGSKISGTYEVPTECPEFNGIAVCMMYHEHAGMIRILTLK